MCVKRRTNDCRKRNQCCLICWRTAAVSHRSLCPAEHLPLQIDYPGGSPRQTQTTAAALIKSQTQVRRFPPTQKVQVWTGTSDIYRGLRMTTSVVIVERDEWKCIFFLLLLWVEETIRFVSNTTEADDTRLVVLKAPKNTFECLFPEIVTRILKLLHKRFHVRRLFLSPSSSPDCQTDQLGCGINYHKVFD